MRTLLPLIPDMQSLYKYLALNHIIIVSQTTPYSTASWMLPEESGAAQALNIPHCTKHTFKTYTITHPTDRALPLYHTVNPAKILGTMKKLQIRKISGVFLKSKFRAGGGFNKMAYHKRAYLHIYKLLNTQVIPAQDFNFF